jgi:hypothetical protein
MHKFLPLFISCIFAATTLGAITSTHASPPSMLTTCTDLETGKTLVLRNPDGKCRTNFGSALWVQEQVDSAFSRGDGYAVMTVCSSRNPRFTYKLIKNFCPKFQVSTNYWRTVAAPSAPIIKEAIARGYNTAVFTLIASKQAIAAPIVHYLITNIKTGQIDKASLNNYGELLVSNLSPLTSYTFTIAAVNVDGSSAASLATPVIRTDAAPVVATTAPVALTCATGGTCVVGDRGPGGGIVYYVSATPFTSTGSTCNTACKYLEVAPAGWNNGGVAADDPLLVWSTNTSLTTGQDTVTAGTESNFANEKFNWKIGQGFYNTSVMKVAGETSTAQAAVLAYAGGSTAGQWFIPSMNELNELCKYARGQTTGNPTVACAGTGSLKTGTADDLGGFVENVYWSSSETSANNAWRQSFLNGFESSPSKGLALYVRPVRAF